MRVAFQLLAIASSEVNGAADVHGDQRLAQLLSEHAALEMVG
jgi:hypothetical protein